MSPGPDIEVYREQLVRLARCLVPDGHSAEDIVQETFVSALERNGDRPSALRRWLREIVRLKARELGRKESRRRRREAAAAVPDRTESVESEALRAACLTAIAREMEELDEPYRSTLRLRFLEELSSRALATRLDLPVQTVYTRTARGLKLLRARLERRLGPLTPLAVLFLPRPASSTAPLGPPARAAATRALWAVGLVAATLVVGALLLDGSADAARASTARAFDRGDDASARLTALTVDETSRQLAGDAEPSRPAPEPTPDGLVVYRGRVEDVQGRPVGGAAVTYESGQLVFDQHTGLDLAMHPGDRRVAAEAGADGSFAIAVPAIDGRVSATAPGLAPVISELVPADRGSDPLVVMLAPAADVRGRVLGAGGEPLVGVHVRLRPPAELVATLDRRERTWLVAQLEGETDETGAFVFEGAYALAGSRLSMVRSDLVEEVELAAGQTEIEVVLEDLPAEVETTRGFVLTPEWEPLEDVAIFAGRMRTPTEADGSFELPVAVLREHGRLSALADGWMPVEVTLFELPDGTFDVPPELLIQVVERTGSLDGLVLDDEGRPLPRAWVWLSDPTPVFSNMSAGFAERWIDPKDAWDIPFAFKTDAEGRFRMPHLLRRSYRIGAMEPDGLRASLTTVEVPASGVVLTVPTSEPARVLRGRVVSKEGEPMADVGVTLLRPMMLVEGRGRRAFQVGRQGFETFTDPSGAYSIPAVPREGCWLKLTGRDVFEVFLDVPEVADGEPVDLVAGRRSRLRVRTDARDGALVALLDAAGERVPVRPAGDDDRMPSLKPAFEAEVRGGACHLLAPDTAVVAVLLDGGEELARRRVDLVRGQVVEVWLPAER